MAEDRTDGPDEDGPEGTDEDGLGAEPVPVQMMTGWQRLSQTFLRPGPPPPRATRPGRDPIDFSKLSDAEVRARINAIDPTERKVGVAAGILAAVFTLVYSVPYMVGKIKVATTVKPVHKTCADHFVYTTHSGAAATCNGVLPASHYTLQLVLGLVFAAAILVTVRIGRRAPVAFAIVLSGLALGTFILFLPFLVAGGWLLVRAWRTQRYGSPTAKSPVEGYVRPAPGSRRPPPAADKASRTSTRRRRGEPEVPAGTRQPPAASKRYTPKAPPRKKVPPSS